MGKRTTYLCLLIVESVAIPRFLIINYYSEFLNAIDYTSRSIRQENLSFIYFSFEMP